MAGESDQNDNTRTHFFLIKDTQVGHYRIIDRIGAGGMGEVYLAHDSKLDRKVALKFLATQYCQDEDYRNRFTREAQAAAKLTHPNIITIHEVGEFKGRPFFAMEYVDGRSLKDLVADDKLTVEQIVELAEQISEGLQAAHEAGVIHRDIKPSNILIDSHGRAKILDFGLAMVRGCGQLTKSGQTAGTPSYMSPEQVRGDPVGVTSDLFSFGIVLYQMLTGRLPFTGDYEASIIYSILNDEPVPVGQLRPEAPEGLQDTVSRLLQKDSKRRFQTAGELLVALRVGSGSTFTGTAIRPGVVRWRGNLLWLGLLVAAVVAVLAITYLVFDPLHLKQPVQNKTLAVLPFVNQGAPEDEYFADGITDEITSHLRKFGALSVISRTSSAPYKGSRMTPQEIGAELGATHLLTGTILWDKSGVTYKVRINPELVRVDDGTSLWADSYERVYDRIFDLQADIAQQVTRELKIALRQADRDELTRRPTSNMMAYDYYLRGNEFFNRSEEQQDLAISIQLYQEAVDLDSTFAEAWAMLSRSHASTYFEYYDHSDERCQLALEAARKSLELQPDLVEGRLALGYWYYHCDRDYNRAMVEFELAMKRDANNADLYNAIAAVQRREGDLQSAVQNFQMAMELDPRSHRRPFDVGLTYAMMRQYRTADEYLERTISLAPDQSLAYIIRAWLQVIQDGDIQRARQLLGEASGKADLTRSKYYWWLARLIETDYRKVMSEIKPGADTANLCLQYAQFHRLLGEKRLAVACADSARAILEEKLKAKPDDPAFLSSLGLAYAYLGMMSEAVTNGEKAVDLLQTTRDALDAPFLILNLAEILVIGQEYEAAVARLRMLLSIPGFVSPSYLKLDPLWQPLRDRADFQALVTEAS